MTDRTHRNIRNAGIVVTWLVLLGGLIWWSAIAYGQVGLNSSSRIDHETRIRFMEKITTETSTDVKWIREHLEKE